MSQQSEQLETQNTALGWACVHYGGFGHIAANSDQSTILGFSTSSCSTLVLKAELKSMNRILELVFFFPQMRQSQVEHGGCSILCRPISCVSAQASSYVFDNELLKAMVSGLQGKSQWSPVWFFERRYDGGALPVSMYYGLVVGDVKDTWEGILQLFCTVSRDVTWYVVWTSGLARVNARKGPLYFIL